MLIESLNQFLWMNLTLPLLIAVGIYLTIRTGFFQVRSFISTIRSTLFAFFKEKGKKGKNGLSAWESVSTALASTIGTGSIFGVVLAIQYGGAGVVFWMWVSAFVGAIIKYAEIVLSLQYRQKNGRGFWTGGPMYYLRHGLNSRLLAFGFAFFCLCTCFGMGNSVQANAIASVLNSRFGLNVRITGFLLAFFAGMVILGGMRKIASFNGKLVPVMSLFYIGCCFVILLFRWERLPSVFIEIFKEAFSFPAVMGGASSYGFVLAMKNGFSKGIFSNEAGLGSAPIAHASCDTENFKEQGTWGMFEVFFTTILVCTMTALVVLSCDLTDLTSVSASTLSVFAFESTLGNFGSFCLVLSIVLFSFSTILGWAFYGEVCLNFLFEKAYTKVLFFRLLFIMAIYLGATSDLGFIWTLAEFFNGLMAIPNLIGVLLLSSNVFWVSKDNF